jgi:uncharacterized protein
MIMRITQLHVYPIKSCRGTAVQQTTVLNTGLRHDRRWMLVDERGNFITQREQGKLALIEPRMGSPDADHTALEVHAPDMPALWVSGDAISQPAKVMVWNDSVAAFDEGDDAAHWFSRLLGMPARLVRFDDAQPRPSNRDWTGELIAYNRFSDGFPLLLISQASLDDLNSRMNTALLMNRFRPNIVVDELPAYDEDELQEFGNERLRLRAVKPCTRCKITTTNQSTGVADSKEPLATLMQYRRNAALRGVVFGQNVMVVSGAGVQLSVGQVLTGPSVLSRK